jgi:hypothetical protein
MNPSSASFGLPKESRGYWDDSEDQRRHGQLRHQEGDAEAPRDEPDRGYRPSHPVRLIGIPGH